MRHMGRWILLSLVNTSNRLSKSSCAAMRTDHCHEMGRKAASVIPTSQLLETMEITPHQLANHQVEVQLRVTDAAEQSSRVQCDIGPVSEIEISRVNERCNQLSNSGQGDCTERFCQQDRSSCDPQTATVMKGNAVAATRLLTPSNGPNAKGSKAAQESLIGSTDSNVNQLARGQRDYLKEMRAQREFRNLEGRLNEALSHIRREELSQGRLLFSAQRTWSWHQITGAVWNVLKDFNLRASIFRGGTKPCFWLQNMCGVVVRWTGLKTEMWLYETSGNEKEALHPWCHALKSMSDWYKTGIESNFSTLLNNIWKFTPTINTAMVLSKYCLCMWCNAD